MERRIINPWTWQDEQGFVQANEISGAERILFVSGQASVDADGKPIHAGDMTAQLRQSVDNLETVLTEAGFGLADVVRLTFFVTDLEAFYNMDRSSPGKMAEAGGKPACSLIGVAKLAFPELLIELEATAVR